MRSLPLDLLNQGGRISEGESGKSVLWRPNVPLPALPLITGISNSRELGIKVLGAAIGSPEFSQSLAYKRVNAVSDLLDKFPLLEDSHFSFVLLRSCFSLPKHSYMTKTSSPAPLSSHYLRFDSPLCSAFKTIVGSPLTELQWLNPCIQPSMGGVGICCSFNHVLAFYL